MSYNVANTYLSTDMSDGNVATNEYNGPDTIWVQVMKEGEKKGKWNNNPIKTNYLDDGDIEDYENEDQTDAIEALPVPLDAVRVKIDCNETPHLCAVWTGATTVGDDTGDYTGLTQTQDSLDGEVYYERPANTSIPPDHVWNKTSSVYNFETEEWEMDLQTTWTSWDIIRKTRDAELALTDVKSLIPEGTTARVAWDEYRQALRDLPKKFEGIEPHTVPMPISPDELDV